MSGRYCEHGVRVEDTHPDMESRCWKCEPATLEEFNEVQEKLDEALQAHAELKIIAAEVRAFWRGALGKKILPALSEAGERLLTRIEAL